MNPHNNRKTTARLILVPQLPLPSNVDAEKYWELNNNPPIPEGVSQMNNQRGATRTNKLIKLMFRINAVLLSVIWFWFGFPIFLHQGSSAALEFGLFLSMLVVAGAAYIALYTPKNRR